MCVCNQFDYGKCDIHRLGGGVLLLTVGFDDEAAANVEQHRHFIKDANYGVHNRLDLTHTDLHVYSIDIS